MITVKKDCVFQALEVFAGTPVLRKGQGEPNARGLPSAARHKWFHTLSCPVDLVTPIRALCRGPDTISS